MSPLSFVLYFLQRAPPAFRQLSASFPPAFRQLSASLLPAFWRLSGGFPSSSSGNLAASLVFFLAEF